MGETAPCLGIPGPHEAPCNWVLNGGPHRGVEGRGAVKGALLTRQEGIGLLRWCLVQRLRGEPDAW